MKTKNIIKGLIFFLFCITEVSAQELLTLESAVKIALENNYEIKIASNNLEIDKTNVAIGNAGMLPTITGSVVDNNRVQNSSQTLQTGQVNSLKNFILFSFKYFF